MEISKLRVLASNKIFFFPVVCPLPEAEDLQVNHQSGEDDHDEGKGHPCGVALDVQYRELDHVVLPVCLGDGYIFSTFCLLQEPK